MVQERKVQDMKETYNPYEMTVSQATCWNDIAEGVAPLLETFKSTDVPHLWAKAVEEYYGDKFIYRYIPRKLKKGPDGHEADEEERLEEVPKGPIIAKAKDSVHLRARVNAILMGDRYTRGRSIREQEKLDARRGQVKAGRLYPASQIRDDLAVHIQGVPKEDAEDALYKWLHWYFWFSDHIFGTDWIKGEAGAAEAAIYLLGEASNGKNLIIDGIAAGFAECGVTSGSFNQSDINGRFRNMEDWAHDFLSCRDWSYMTVMESIETLKELVTGGIMRFERKGGLVKNCPMTGRAVILAGNDEAANLTIDKGMKRRLSVIPMLDLSFIEQDRLYGRVHAKGKPISASIFTYLSHKLCSVTPCGYNSIPSLPSLLLLEKNKDINSIYIKEKWENQGKEAKNGFATLTLVNRDRLSASIKRKYRLWAETPADKGGGANPTGGKFDTGSFARMFNCVNFGSFNRDCADLMKAFSEAGLVVKKAHSRYWYTAGEDGPVQCVDFLCPDKPPAPMTLDEVYALLDSVFDFPAIDAYVKAWNASVDEAERARLRPIIEEAQARIAASGPCLFILTGEGHALTGNTGMLNIPWMLSQGVPPSDIVRMVFRNAPSGDEDGRIARRCALTMIEDHGAGNVWRGIARVRAELGLPAAV